MLSYFLYNIHDENYVHNKVPLHLHTNWDSFYVEMLMLGGLGAYLLNYLAGKAKNQKLAQAWLTAHKQLLEENFAVIG